MSQKSNSINLPEINAQKARENKSQLRASKENLPPNTFGKSNSFLLSNNSVDTRHRESKTLQSGVFASRTKRIAAPFGQRNESMSNGASRLVLRSQQTEHD